MYANYMIITTTYSSSITDQAYCGIGSHRSFLVKLLAGRLILYTTKAGELLIKSCCSLQAPCISGYTL
jgi:hypothetical protein